MLQFVVVDMLLQLYRHCRGLLQGCDTFTVSPACAAELLEDPLTEAAAAAFEESASKMGAKMT